MIFTGQEKQSKSSGRLSIKTNDRIYTTNTLTNNLTNMTRKILEDKHTPFSTSESMKPRRKIGKYLIMLGSICSFQIMQWPKLTDNYITEKKSWRMRWMWTRTSWDNLTRQSQKELKECRPWVRICWSHLVDLKNWTRHYWVESSSEGNWSPLSGE